MKNQLLDIYCEYSWVKAKRGGKGNGVAHSSVKLQPMLEHGTEGEVGIRDLLAVSFKIRDSKFNTLKTLKLERYPGTSEEDGIYSLEVIDIPEDAG